MELRGNTKRKKMGKEIQHQSMKNNVQKIGAVTRTCCVDLSLRPLQGESAGRENRSAGRVSGATSPEQPENVKQFSVVIDFFAAI